MSGTRGPLAAARAEAGQAVVFVALALMGVLAGVGVGVDAALLFVEHRREQVAADAAAFAAAVEMAKHWQAPDRATRARMAALSYAASNGFNNDGVTNTVAVNVPPASGGFAGNADYAEVIIDVNVRTVFLRLLGPGFAAREVRGRAVGGIVGPDRPYAIVALSKTACPGLEVLGGGGGRKAEIETEDAGILVNASCAAALRATGRAEIEADEGGVDVAGGVQLTGNAEVRPAPTTGAPQRSDPLAYLTPPTILTPGSLVEGSCSNTSVGAYPFMVATAGTCTLNPGVYEGLSVTGTGKMKLLPGTYILRGGGMSATGNGRIEDETHGDARGVFVYNACSNYPAAGGTCGAITVAGNGRIELEKETTGAYAGLSIWQPCENTQALSVSGGGADATSGVAGADDGDDDEDGELETSGTIYLPCAGVAVSGHGEIEVENGQVVADTVTVSGNAELEVDWDAAASTASRIPAVVE